MGWRPDLSPRWSKTGQEGRDSLVRARAGLGLCLMCWARGASKPVRVDRYPEIGGLP